MRLLNLLVFLVGLIGSFMSAWLPIINQLTEPTADQKTYWAMQFGLVATALLGTIATTVPYYLAARAYSEPEVKRVLMAVYANGLALASVALFAIGGATFRLASPTTAAVFSVCFAGPALLNIWLLLRRGRSD